MQYHTIASYQDYLDLCDYIEQDNPSVVEIGENYFVTEDRHYLLEYDVKGILEDINTYVFGEVMDTAPDKILSKSNSIVKRYTIIKNKDQYEEAINHIKSSDFLAYDVESDGLNVRKNKVIGFSFCGAKGVGYYLPIFEFNKETQTLDRLDYIPEEWISGLLNLLAKKDLLMWNASFDIRITKNNLKVNLTNALIADVLLMKHTVMEEGEFSLKGVALQFQDEIGIDAEKEANEEQIILKQNIQDNGGSATKTNYELFKADLDIIGKYACADVDLTLRLGELFLKKINEEGLDAFFFEHEVMPLYKEVTIVMEDKGVPIDLKLMKETDEEIKKEISAHKKKVLDLLFESDKVADYYISYLQELYPASNKGTFAQELCKKYKVGLPLTKSGKFSITDKTVKALPDGKVKEFLLSGNISLLDEEEIQDLQHSIHIEKEGEEFNILSKLQMGIIAFKVLGYKPLSTTDKGAPQFDEDMIDDLDKKGVEWASILSDYNKLIKQKGTYIDRFLEAQEDGIFYPSFFQHRTISGRYGSDMQQLPRPKEEGELRPIPLKFNNIIRKFFIAGEGRKFIDNDYESLEPHVFAHVSNDEGLRDIFRKGNDFYSTIAIATEGISDASADKKAPNYLGKINKVKRQSAKAYSLGVPYGMSSYALAKTLDVSKERGQELVDGYLSAYPELKKWMKNSEKMAKTLGYVKTETGRIRHLPKVKEIYNICGDDLLDYKKKNTYNKEYGKDKVIEMYRDYKNGINNAKNFQIQGLSASIVNRAAIAINREFKKLNIDGYVTLQIHDQLVMNVPEKEAEKCAKIVQDIMENNYKLSLKLKAVPQIADNLLEGH